MIATIHLSYFNVDSIYSVACSLEHWVTKLTRKDAPKVVATIKLSSLFGYELPISFDENTHEALRAFLFDTTKAKDWTKLVRHSYLQKLKTLKFINVYYM